MKSLYNCVKSDVYKLRHTPVIWLHILIPVLGALAFLGYYILYRRLPDKTKIQMMVEFTVMVYPILIGVISGLVILQEEKAGHFTVMLEINNRRAIAFLSKLVLLIVLSAAALFLLFALFSIESIGFHLLKKIPLELFLKLWINMLVGNSILYLFHLFINIKFGIGSSIFLGVIESLLVVLFSNIDMKDIWVYIPFAWTVKMCQNSMDGINNIGVHSFAIAIIIIVGLMLSLIWFSKWEGRKYYE